MSRIRFLLLAAAAVAAEPAAAVAAAPPECGYCLAQSHHGYRSTAPRGDPGMFVTPLDHYSQGTGPRTAGGDTALGSSFAHADTGVLKARAAFTGSLADMPNWLQDDQVTASAAFRDALTFAGPGPTAQVTVNLPLDYILGARSPGAQTDLFTAPLIVRIGWGVVNHGFGYGYNNSVTRYLDGAIAAAQPIQDPTLYFAPSHEWRLDTLAGGAFAHTLSHSFTIPTGRAYAMHISLTAKTSNASGTRLADASHTLIVAPFTGTFTSVTSSTFGVLGPTGYAPFMPTSSVPEPATWALVILGFGAVGIARRRAPAAGSARLAPPSRTA